MVAISMPSCAPKPRSFSGWQRACSTLTTPVGSSTSKATKPPYAPSSTPRRGLDRAYTRHGHRPYEPRLVHQSEPTDHHTRRSAAQQPQDHEKWQESGNTAHARLRGPGERPAQIVEAPSPNPRLPRPSDAPGQGRARADPDRLRSSWKELNEPSPEQ